MARIVKIYAIYNVKRVLSEELTKFLLYQFYGLLLLRKNEEGESLECSRLRHCQENLSLILSISLLKWQYSKQF